MLATVLAVMLVLVTLLIYQVPGARLEATALSRRQLDTWAVLSSLVALALILYGGSTAPRAMRADAEPSSDAAPPPAQMDAWPETTHVATLTAMPPDPGSPRSTPTSEAQLQLPSAAEEAARVGGAEPIPLSRPSDAGHADSRSMAPAADPAFVVTAASVPQIDPPAPIVAPATPSPAAVDSTVKWVPAATVAPIPTVRLAGSAPLPPRIVPISPTEQPTEAPPPALELEPTPVCGDPREMRISLRIAEAQAERQDDGQVVRYQAEIENQSAFPIVAGSIVAVAQDGRSSADQFGVERLPDMRIDALREVGLRGTIFLTRHPSPMSRSELCISFVAETCGRRGDDLITRRCFNIDGF